MNTTELEQFENVLKNEENKEDKPVEMSFQDKMFNKINVILTELNERLIEREELNMLLVLAIFSKSHIFLIGKPGVGKTFAIHLLKDAVEGAKYFETLIMHDTKPEELFGTTFIDSNGRLNYDIEHTVIDSHFVFLDEVFKGTSQILNGLLSITSNDRNFFMRPHGEIKVPLNTFFAASNEFPSDEALDPFDDRLPIRYEVERIKDPNNFKRLITKDFKTGELKTKIYLEEIEKVFNEAKDVYISDDMLNILTSLKDLIIKDGIDMSDRKFSTAVNILKVMAYLNNRNKLNYSDTFLLLHIGWRDFTDRRKLREVIFKFWFSTKDAFLKDLITIENMIKNVNLEISKIDAFLNKSLVFNQKNIEDKEKVFLSYLEFTKQILVYLEELFNKNIQPLYGLLQQIYLVEKEIEDNIFLINFKNQTVNQVEINRLENMKKNIENQYNFIASFIQQNSTLLDYENN